MQYVSIWNIINIDRYHSHKENLLGDPRHFLRIESGLEKEELGNHLMKLSDLSFFQPCTEGACA